MPGHIFKLIESAKRVFTPARIAVIAACAAFFFLVVLGDKGIYELRQVLNMKYRQIALKQKLNDDIDRLTKEKEILSDPANLEPTIRMELGYIKPGEVVFEEKGTESR